MKFVYIWAVALANIFASRQSFFYDFFLKKNILKITKNERREKKRISIRSMHIVTPARKKGFLSAWIAKGTISRSRIGKPPRRQKEEHMKKHNRKEVQQMLLHFGAGFVGALIYGLTLAVSFARSRTFGMIMLLMLGIMIAYVCVSEYAGSRKKVRK